MKFIKIIFLIYLIALTTQKVTKRRGRKHRKYYRPMLSARKTYVDVPAILKAIQKIAEVHHHDAINFDKVSGGINSIVLPRDAPTLIVNQLPIREFRLKDIDHESMSEMTNNSYNMYDRYLKQVDSKSNISLKELEKNEKNINRISISEKNLNYERNLKSFDTKKNNIKELKKNEKSKKKNLFLRQDEKIKNTKPLENKLYNKYV